MADGGVVLSHCQPACTNNNTHALLFCCSWMLTCNRERACHVVSLLAVCAGGAHSWCSAVTVHELHFALQAAPTSRRFGCNTRNVRCSSLYQSRAPQVHAHRCIHTSCSHAVITARLCSRCRLSCSTCSCRCCIAAAFHDLTARRCMARWHCWLACSFTARHAAAAPAASLKCPRMRRHRLAFASASAAAWRACCAS